MSWYLQIDGKMGCRTREDVSCALGEDQEVAEHWAAKFAGDLPGRDVKAVEQDYCPAQAEDDRAFAEYSEAGDPQARERALEQRLDLALAALADVEWQDVGGDERRCPCCGAGEHQDGHSARGCKLHQALQGQSGRH